jgi:hypothetical protein
MTTFSGTLYNFQAEGEFVVAKSTKPGDTFQIQARMEPYYAGASVSVMKMIGAEVGSDRVTFSVDRADTVWIDGAPSTLSATNTVVNLSGGQLVQLAPGTYRLTWNSGEVMTVTSGGTYLNLQVSLGQDGGPGTVQGLLGADEGPAKDFQLADGTVLTNLTTDQLYGEFADAWRVTDATSILDYGAGETTATFTDKNFPADGGLTLADLPADLVAQAKAAAVAAGITDPNLIDAAALDFIVTGDPNILSADANIALTTGTTTAADVTPSAPPPLLVGVTATAASVVEAASGSTPVTFSVYLSQTALTDTVVDYTVTTPTSGFLDADAFGGTLPTGQLTIAAGQTTGQFTIQLPDGVLGSVPTENLGVQISAPGGDLVVAANAQTTIVNSTPVPGNPASPLLAEITSAGTFANNGNDYTLDLGTLVEGQSLPIQLGVFNTSTAPADDLGGSIRVSSGTGFALAGGGTISTLAPGTSYQGLTLTAGTATLGSHTETITFKPIDSNITGYSAALADETLTITDTVEAAAEGTVNSATTVNLPNVRVGSADTQAVSITNSAAPPAADLDVSLGSLNGGTTESGSISALAPGATDTSSISVGVDTSAGGQKSGLVTLNFASDTGSNTAPLPSQEITVFGQVFRVAQAAVSPSEAIVHVGDAGTEALVVTNDDPADEYSEGLRATLGTSSGGITAAGGPTGLIAAGESDTSSLSVDFSTAAAGVVSGTVGIDFSTDGTGTSGLAAADLGTSVIPISITVDNHAQATLEDLSGIGTFSGNGNAYTLDLGSVTEGSAPLSVSLGVLNSAVGPADLLSGVFDVGGDSAFVNSNTGPFSGLGAGSEYDPTISLSTDTVGSFTETITLHPTGSNASGFSEALADETLTVTGTVTSPLSNGEELLHAATEGAALASSTAVASFSDANASEGASAFTATIDWGDGTQSAGTLVGSDGSFTVEGGHTYTNEGASAVGVTVTRTADLSQIVISGPITVADADVFTPHGTSFSVDPSASFGGTVATFDDAYLGEAASDLAATIVWGDGSTTAGTVTGSNGSFTVSGGHAYAAAGTDAVETTLSDIGGTATATADSTAYVGGVLTGQIGLTQATEGTALAGNTAVATFSDSNPFDTAASFTAMIDWGDGTAASAGTVSLSNGTYTVAGGHTFAQEGNPDVTVTVTRSDNSTTSFSGQVAVADADSFTPTPVSFTADQNVAFSGTVATFADTYLGEPASDLSASIDWGDGTAATVGTVSGSNGNFSVAGGHTYTSNGTKPVTVTLTDIGGTASSVADSTATVLAAAQAQVAPSSPINLGNLRAGSSATEFITVTNAATAPAATLDVTSILASGALTANGTIAPLAAGASDGTDLSVTLANSAGSQTGSLTLGFASDDGMGTVTPLPSQTLQVEGKFFREASASAGSLPSPFIVHVGDSVQQALSIINSAAADGFSENLIAKVTGTTGGVSTTASATGDIAAGAAGSLTLGFATAIAGTISGSVTLEFDSDGTNIDGAGPTEVGTQTIAVNATVDNVAVAAFSELSGGGALTHNGNAYTLDLGSLTQGSASQTVALDLLNAATGPADLLSGKFSVSGSTSQFINSGMSNVSGLAAQQSFGPFDATIATGTVGSFSETITFAGTGSNASGYSGSIGNETFTIEGNIVAPSGQVKTLTTGADTFTGGSANNTIIANAGTINSGDSIDGGSGGTNQNNTLVLQGPGTFDLTLPTSLTDIETVSATMGQPAYVGNGQSFASQQQSLNLRNNLYVTIGINQATLNPGNPSAASITISNYNVNDVFDIVGLQFTSQTSASFKASRGSTTSGVLTVDSAPGQIAATINLLGQYAASSFVAMDDLDGGTLIEDATNPLGFHHA